MPVDVACSGCGVNYRLKDEYAGRRVKCPGCQSVIAVPAPDGFAGRPGAGAFSSEDSPTRRPTGVRDSDEPVGRQSRPAYTAEDDDPDPRPRPANRYRDDDDEDAVERDDDPIFGRDKFLLRQKVWTIKEKYTVSDEDGDPILYVERPVHLMAGCLAMFVGILVMGVLIGGGVAVGMGIGGNVGTAVAIVAGVVGFIVGLVVIIALYPKRHIRFCEDDRLKDMLLHVSQDQKVVLINMWYTLRDADGEVIARFRKNHLHNFLRKRWYIYDAEGELICVVKEDSIILSLLRRTVGYFLEEIPLLGLAVAAVLRTNFIFLRPTDNEQLGMFNRKMTLLDRYVLDMEDDPKREIDRRVAVVMGVLLDTGERR